MKLTEIWKKSMKEVFSTIYGNQINNNILDKFLDKEIENHKDDATTLWLRNLYTGQNFAINTNDILDVVEKEDLCINANNCFTYSLNRIESPVPHILIDQKAERKLHKKKMLEAKEAIANLKLSGKYYEGCPEDTILLQENCLQLKIKTFMNSIYGVQGQRGSFLYSPDTAGAVTAQGRELIAEMAWTLERMLYGTLHFSDLNEMFSYFNAINKHIDKNNILLNYITYYPTKEDINKKFGKMFHDTDGFYNEKDEIINTLYGFISNLTPIQRLYFYYAENLFDLITKNRKVFDLFDTIIESDIPYLTPAGKPKQEFLDKYRAVMDAEFPTRNEYWLNVDSTGKRKEITEALVYEKYNPILNKICDLIDAFVLTPISTAQRVIKYPIKRRRGIIVSDTDSVIINLHPYITNLTKLNCLVHNKPFRGEHVGFYDENLEFKLINVMNYIITFGTEKAGDILANGAHSPKNLRNWIEMKNEFLFKRIVMYKNTKKNYVVHCRLQEGKIIDDVTPTGIKLNSSIIHPSVKEMMMNCIENDILKSETIDPVNIMLKVKDMERKIIDNIKSGDYTLGRRARYSGAKGYKTGVYRNDAGRSAFIWNILYPTMKIEVGGYGYIFPTIVYTTEDVRTKLFNFPKESELLLERVFKDTNLSQYGLRSIMIPVNDSITHLPEWLVSIIDYEKITNKHLQPIISLLPSIGLNNSAISSSKQNYSTLINF